MSLDDFERRKALQQAYQEGLDAAQAENTQLRSALDVAREDCLLLQRRFRHEELTNHEIVADMIAAIDAVLKGESK